MLLRLKNFKFHLRFFLTTSKTEFLCQLREYAHVWSCQWPVINSSPLISTWEACLLLDSCSGLESSPSALCFISAHDWRPRVLLPLVLSVSACLALSRLESLVGRWSISSLLICFMLWNCLSICASHHWDSGKVCLNSLLAISGKRWSEQLHDKEAKYYFGKLGPEPTCRGIDWTERRQIWVSFGPGVPSLQDPMPDDLTWNW